MSNMKRRTLPADRRSRALELRSIAQIGALSGGRKIKIQSEKLESTNTLLARGHGSDQHALLEKGSS
jgi:hypothetical protein